MGRKYSTRDIYPVVDGLVLLIGRLRKSDNTAGSM